MHIRSRGGDDIEKATGEPEDPGCCSENEFLEKQILHLKSFYVVE